MNTTRPARHSRPVALASLLALAVASGLAGSAARADEARNPFVPNSSGSAPAATNTALDSLELRGVMSFGNTTQVTLYDKSSSKSYTVGVNEGVNNWKVTGYNPADDSVVVEAGGQKRNIALNKPKIVATAAAPVMPPGGAPIAMPMPVPGQPPRMPPGMTPQPGSVPTPVPQMSDQEVRERMNRVAEEIQRRRQMRREMIERAQQQQPQQPAPAQSQP